MSLNTKICESDQKDKFGSLRHARLVGSQRGFCEDLYLIEENGHVVIRQELGRSEGPQVRWLTASEWSGGYEADCPFKDGLILDILDADGRVVATETTYHTEWNGGGLADKVAPFSWEVENDG